MNNKKNYAESCKVGQVEFGCCVKGVYYPGNKLTEGDNFTEDQFEYVSKLGDEWQKGHLLAKSLGGHNEGDNMLPMKQSFNDGIFKSFEHDIKNTIDNLSAIQKELANTPIFLGYRIEVLSTSFKTYNGIRIPTQIQCTVGIYKQADNRPVHTMLLDNAFKKLNLEYSIIGQHIFDTDK